MDQQVLTMLADNIIAGFAAFLAIVVWVKTRDSSWIFIVLAVLGYYSSVIYRTLLFFGIVPSEVYVIYGLDAVNYSFIYVPQLFFLIALIIKTVKNMHR
jgi:hypothetical protein